MTQGRYRLNTIPRTRAQFASRLKTLDACTGARVETQGKTLRQAWDHTTELGYLTYWMRFLGNTKAWNRRCDQLIERAFKLNRMGKFATVADAYRSLVSYDGHRPGYRLAQARMGRARNTRKRK